MSPPHIRRNCIGHSAFKAWKVEAIVLINEVAATAERIAAARTPAGMPVRPTDAVWSLLCALERTDMCLSVSDAARTLRVSRQRAHRLAVEAARREHIEWLTSRHDRRLVQMQLTPRGRYLLESARAAEEFWAISLLNGLDLRQMRATAHILRVIRQRLVREERAQRE